MIVLFLKDGLGNQMFEYSFARHIQLITGEKIVLNRFFFKRKNRRSFALDIFELNDNVVVLNRWKEIYWAIFFFVKLILIFNLRLFKFVKKDKELYNIINFKKNSKKGLYFTLNTFGHYKDYDLDSKLKIIYGNYINPKYFIEDKNYLKRDFKLVIDIDEINKSLLDNINKSNSVCVHIRRGDYLNPEWKSLNICDYDYYAERMRDITERISNPIFYVFSDSLQDVIWIENNYRFKFNVVYVKNNNPAHEDFRLMMACQHFILSNSTFGWWACYLGKNDNSVVYLPEDWKIKNI